MAEPYCLAMVVCDGVHREPVTSKFTILGTFGNFTARSYPADIQFVVYFAITDGLGPVTIRLQLVDASVEPIDASIDGDIEGRVFKIEQVITFPGPLAIVEGAFGVRTTLPHAGVYHCELWGNNESLMSRRLSALALQEGEQGDQQDEPGDHGEN